MIRIRWKIVITLSLCLLLLLTACDDNVPVVQMQNIADAPNTAEVTESNAVPATVSTAEADSSSTKTVITYDVTTKAAQQKADTLLTKPYGTNSVQYALIDHGNITISGEAGKNDEHGVKPLTKDTMYGIGSISKMFTTVAVMQLVEQGKINLDTPIVQYITEFTMKDERFRQITPRMLLNHSSGLNGSSLMNAKLFKDNDTYAHDTLLKQLAGQTLKADPGAYSVYCNDGFTLAEILVEQVSGMDFTSYIHRYITEPLGMNGTKTPLDSPDTVKMAGLYYPTYTGQLPTEAVNVIGTGGIYSTAEDLARFSQIFTGEAEEVLSGKSAEAMAQAEYKTPLWPDDADNSIDFGLGWDGVNLYPFSEYGMKALTKGGDTPLYHASLVVLPEQEMAAAVISSGGASTYDQLLATEILLQALKEKGVIAEFKPEKSYGAPVKADMPESLLQYSGIYGATGTTMNIDIAEDGGMSITPEHSSENPVQFYQYSADGMFHSPDGNTLISFVTEDNGRTYEWIRQYAVAPGLGQLAVSMYNAEKLQPQNLPAQTMEAWMQRDGKKYYPVNEKFTSLIYLLLPPTQLNLSEQLPGYVLDKRITGPDSAVSELQIPGNSGRDLASLTFFTQDGVEYLKTGGFTLVNEDAMKPIHIAKKSTVTIQQDGYARWYTISDKDWGKTIKVSMSPNASFAIYNLEGTCIYFSVIGDKDQVKLPAGGSIVFAGDTGTKFEISVQ
ncbi:serine hydrolase domain-containing protein [Paenibacillus sp. MMS20-IR301]|uniref:serine hydrolase domain-containing protein n=1 Tax=Paenibacillus sp. MMS20-IR301 TaxID=2895946 RepID=UPI0028E1EF60|nr:serine hydrolase domain-containing protein [Paenibacillus sp. MMS20-IR301]WNS44229.1 serine hydrolase domain-containing protein [Paenibacillus sp. MMS20-IR301]